jgi:Xaa-Pro dipeptidase
MRERIKKIFEHSRSLVEDLSKSDADLDAIVFMNAVEPQLDMSFFYATGLVDGLFESASSVIFPDGEQHVISPALEETTAKKGKYQLSIFNSLEENNDHLRTILKGVKTVGINADELTYGNYLRLKENCGDDARFINIGPAVKAARAVKDEAELETLGVSCKIVSDVARSITDIFEEGVKENEVAAELSYRMQKLGANKSSFTLVSFGELTAEPHYMGGSRALENNKFIILDFGAVYRMYNSDITRTYYKGKPDDRAMDLFEHAKRAQEVALEEIRAGANAREVHGKVKDYIDSTKYKGLFPHSTGHTLGLSIHDGERLFNHDLILEENMVFTVEPGIYIPGYGGVRIEDDVVITKDGYRSLTDAPKELRTV